MLLDPHCCLRWCDMKIFCLVSYRMTNMSSWPQFKKSRFLSFLIMHVIHSLLQNGLNQIDTPFWHTFGGFIFKIMFLKTTTKVMKKIYCPTSTVHKKEEQQESHLPTVRWWHCSKHWMPFKQARNIIITTTHTFEAVQIATGVCAPGNNLECGSF